MKKIVIVGGGAAGLAAAIAAADTMPQEQISILERLNTPGKKLLSTGNGRCNLTNSRADASHYQTSSPSALERIFQGMTPDMVLQFFRQLGLWCAEEEEGRIYPRSRQASSVTEVLHMALKRRNIRAECGSPVTGIFRKKQGFRLTREDGKCFAADAVILTFGGKAAGKLGSDGSGYRLAKAMGHHWAPFYPALVPLKCDMSRWGSLKGVRAQAGVRLLCQETLLGEAQGEVQFTEYGLSGIPVMQLSGLLSKKAPGAAAFADVDLFPEASGDALLWEMQNRLRRYGEEPCRHLLTGLLHEKLWEAVLRNMEIAPEVPMQSLTAGQLADIASILKRWRFPVLGTLGYDHAQVSGGGIFLEEIAAETMESRLQPGLYFAGEMLDAAGECGGFNLHWAWCSGIRAGQSAAQKLMQE